MRSQGCARKLEQLRVLAVTRVHEGWRQKEVAAFLGVHPVTVSNWVRAARQAGSLDIAALSVTAPRRRLGLFFHADPKRYLDAPAVAGFLRTLLRPLRGRVIILWDGGSNHKGPFIRAVVADFPRLHLERRPAYTPDLNPVEFVWSHLKYGRLANFIPRNVRHLDRVVQSHLHALKRSPKLLKQLWHGSKLPFPGP